MKPGLFDLLVATSKLDIVELNYEYSSERLGTIDKPIAGLKSKSIAKHFILTLYYTIRSALRRLVSKTSEEHVSDILFFCQGGKHAWALRPVAEHVPNSSIIDNTKGLSAHFSNFKVRLISLIFLPLLLKNYFDADDYKRRSIRYVFDHYLLTYGSYFVFRRFFQLQSVEALVVANDHSYKCTTIRQAAEDANVKTFYIQHASVTDRFPALKFDYALLEGIDALVKYNRCGSSNTTVFLVGMPKLDAFASAINRNDALECLGVCPNNLDSLDRVEEVVKELRRDFPDLIIRLRPHPGDTRRGWKNLCSKYSIEYCDPTSEVSLAFLSKVDAIIVGNSSVALDAALLNVYPLYFDFPDMRLDHYNFVRDGLIDRHTNRYADIKAWIGDLAGKKPEIRHRTKRYCDTVDTAYDGQSSRLAADLIVEICREGNSIDDRWVKVKDTDLEAYACRRGQVDGASPPRVRGSI